MSKHFGTLGGIKRAARKLKHDSGITHGEALERVSKQAGFPTYRHAFEAYTNSDRQLGYPVAIYQSWFVRSERKWGQETQTVHLAAPLAQLVRPHHLVGYLGGTRIPDPGSLVGHGVEDDPGRARAEVCRLIRVLQFMAATGLKPTRSNRAYPDSDWQKRPPGIDHDHSWFDPVTKGYVLTDEPYPGRAQIRARDRETWCAEHGYQIIQSRWGSVYGHGTELYLISKRARSVDLPSLAERLERSAPPVQEKNWIAG